MATPRKYRKIHRSNGGLSSRVWLQGPFWFTDPFNGKFPSTVAMFKITRGIQRLLISFRNFKPSTIWNQWISESTERNGISVPFAHSTTTYARHGRNSVRGSYPLISRRKKCSWKMDIQRMLFFLGKAAFSKQFRCKSVVHHKLNSTQLRGKDRLPARRPQWSRDASQAKNCESNCFGRLQNITRNSSHNLYFHIHMIIYVCNCMYCISILYVLYEIYITFTTIFL